MKNLIENLKIKREKSYFSHNYVDTDTKRLNKIVTIGLVAIIVFIVVFTIFTFINDDKQWNNGYCPNCGTKWEFMYVENIPSYVSDNGHIHSDRRYLYVCPKCGGLCELYHNPYNKLI